MSTSNIIIEHIHKKFEINRTKIKGGCQSGRKVVPHDSKSDLPLARLAGQFETDLQADLQSKYIIIIIMYYIVLPSPTTTATYISSSTAATRFIHHHA